MSKSRRNCYYRNHREFFGRDRPLSWASSNKENKVMSHRIERAWVAERIYKEVRQYYEMQ